MLKETSTKPVCDPPNCPHRTAIEEVRDDLRDVLKLLRGDGPNDPGVVGRILRLESQSTELTETWRLIRNTAIGAIVVGFVAFIGSLVTPLFGAK